MADPTDGENGTKAGDEDLTKFTSIDPETLAPELKVLYKSMQADYTGKTQAVAEIRKEFTEKETQWQDKLKESGAAEQELKQWRDWYQGLQDQQDGGTSGQGEDPQKLTGSSNLPSYLEEPDSKALSEYLDKMKTGQDTELAGLKSEIEALRSTLQDTSDQTSKMFSYHAQLNDLAGEHKDLDKQALLDHALKTGQTDLTKAYKDLHQDELIEVEVAKRVKETIDKERTKGIHGPAQQVLIKPSPDTPKSFGEATEQIVNERATQGLLSP